MTAINKDTLLAGLSARIHSLKDAEELILDNLELIENNNEPEDMDILEVLADLRFYIKSLTRFRNEQKGGAS
jgi:hypothetical protein